MNELPEDLQQALAAADAHAPPAPGRNVSPATLHLALARQRRNRLVAGLAATSAIAGLLLLRNPPELVPVDDGMHVVRADLRALQAELRAARAFPTTATVPIRSDGAAMHLRVELATVAADACRTHFAPSKETR